MRLSRLREHPEFADIVAERGWTAWWTESGVPLRAYRASLEPMMSGAGISFALVAREGRPMWARC
jgi:hypothetical protein